MPSAPISEVTSNPIRFFTVPEEAADAMRLPSGRVHQFGDGGATLPAKKLQHRGGLRRLFGSTRVRDGRSSPLPSRSIRHRLDPRRRLALDPEPHPAHGCRAAPTHSAAASASFPPLPGPVCDRISLQFLSSWSPSLQACAPDHPALLPRQAGTRPG